MLKPILAVTMGDAAGIGPEVVVKAVLNPNIQQLARPMVWGSIAIMRAALKQFGLPSNSLEVISDFNQIPHHFNESVLYCYEPQESESLDFNQLPIGQVSSTCGKAAYDYIVSATKAVLAQQAQAIVTAPVNKASINLANIPFQGHTELIAELCDCQNYTMQQSAGKLHVAFVTTHIPLCQVSEAVTSERIVETTCLLQQSLLAEGIAQPLIAICGLNPHAGENGYMGDEELKTVIPAMNTLKKMGFNLVGPVPSDTLFIAEHLKPFDGVVAMYHDQGHIPFKMLAFDIGVNSTLGLPIIRTSVDHGTAFNLAWQGKASAKSLEEAIKLAALKINNK